MIGPHVTDLIAEAMLITNWEAVPAEVAALIHPHPSLSEAIGEAHLALAGKPLHTRLRSRVATTQTRQDATAEGRATTPRRRAEASPVPPEALPLLRRADGDPVPPREAPGRDLLRPGAGRDAHRRRAPPRARRLALPDAPRPVRADREGPRPEADHGPVLGSDRRLHARPGRQQPHRRLVREQDVDRDVAPADRLPRRGRRGVGLPAARRAARRHGDLRRRRDVERPVA